MTRLAAGWQWSPSGRPRRIPGWVARPVHDPRLQQDMESELAADVEWYDHPTKGRIRLVDELVHPQDALPWTQPAVTPVAADGDDLDLDCDLEALPDERDDWPQPFYDRRAPTGDAG